MGQTFGDSSFSHTGFPDKDGVVLGPAGEYLEYTADLFIPSDHRIELTLLGKFDEVPAVFVECLILLFCRM